MLEIRQIAKLPLLAAFFSASAEAAIFPVPALSFAKVPLVSPLLSTRAQSINSGPLIQLDPKPANTGIIETEVAAAKSDPQFRALFNSWRRLGPRDQERVTIPSAQPNSNTLSIERRYGEANCHGSGPHAGVDIRGLIGEPVYATADGVVGRTGSIDGFINVVELEHGNGIQTRYGQLQSVVASPGTRVGRGQIIGFMGGDLELLAGYLHYEVRLEGRAVDPGPFLGISSAPHKTESRKSRNVDVPTNSCPRCKTKKTIQGPKRVK